MRLVLLAVPALLALSACADGVTFRLPSLSQIGGNSQAQERLAAFCAEDFVTANVATLGEYVMVYNALAPLLDREPIDMDGLYQREAVQKLLAAREVLCFATAPAPAAVEAVAAAE